MMAGTCPPSSRPVSGVWRYIGGRHVSDPLRPPADAPTQGEQASTEAGPGWSGQAPEAPGESLAPTPPGPQAASPSGTPTLAPRPPSGWVQPSAPPPPTQWGDPGSTTIPTSTPPSVLIAAIILLLFGLLTLLTGVIVLFAGSVVGQLGDVFDEAGLSGIQGQVSGIIVGVGAVVAIGGGLELLGAIGIFAHRAWGRAVGVVMSALGVLFGLLALVGALAVDTTTDDRGGLIVALVILAAYGFSLLALAFGGHAFRHSA